MNVPQPPESHITSIGSVLEGEMENFNTVTYAKNYPVIRSQTLACC